MAGRADWGVASQTLTIPPFLGPNDPGIIIGADLPPELVAYYAAEFGATLHAAQVFQFNATNYIYIAMVSKAFAANFTFGYYDGVAVAEIYRADSLSGTKSLLFGARETSTGLDFVNAAVAIFDFASELQMTANSVFQSFGTLQRQGRPARWVTDIQAANATANLVLNTGAAVAVPGTSVTVTAGANGAVYIATAAYDINWTAAGATTATMQLKIDGALQAKSAFFESNAADTPRVSISQQYQGTLTAGAHTFELFGSKSVAAGTVQADSTQTGIIVTLYE